MICKKCSAQLPDDSSFCVHCGTKLAEGSNDTPLAVNQMPMKWFKFLIYFALFFGALGNLSLGIQYLSGGIYSYLSSGLEREVTAEMMYDFYGSGLKTLDQFYGIACIALAAFAIYVRFALAGYKKNAPTLITVSYVVSAIVSVIYMSVASSIFSAKGVEIQISSVYGTVAISVVMVIVNIRYFGNRRHLFVN